jgi:beta-ketoacyl-acyl-carrier-protein synthase II
MHERVVITGMGAITPIGHTFPETWRNVLDGVSGVGPITLFDTQDFNVKIACEVKNFDPTVYLSRKEARRRDRYEQFASAAISEAMAHAGLEITAENAPRIGVMISSSGGGMRSIEETAYIIKEKGPRRLSPYSSAMIMSNGGAGMASIDLGAQGPSFSVASACASGADGLGMAWLMLRAGVIDAAIAGASDALITGVTVGSLDRSGAMCRREGDGLLAPQPFDLNRDGFVIGEGAAVVILETESHAHARGASILAELAGYAATADAYHITAPHDKGRGAARAMQLALEAARVSPEGVDYINAHGTGTVLNDVVETRAIKTVFGQHAYKIPVSSTKSMTGHMVGVTPVVEAIFSVLAICEGTLPPTINYQTPDPACDLDYIPNTARRRKTRLVVSNSFGFGGHNAVLVIREFI